LRVRRASDSALAVANHFQGHPTLQAVLYPGLPSHPGHQVAARQMREGFGRVLSIRLVGGAESAMAALPVVRVFKRATSLGGVESLIEHRRSTEGPSSPVPDDLLCLSIGIEAPEDLIADLEAALGGARPRRPAAAPPYKRRARRPAPGWTWSTGWRWHCAACSPPSSLGAGPCGW
jgi:cystathionine gamma-synthase